MKRLTVFMVLLAMLALAGCGGKAPVQEQAAAEMTAEPAEDVIKAVAASVPCSEQEAEKLLADMEEITGSRFKKVEVYSIAELPDNTRRILQCETDDETYIVSISEETTVSKVVHMQDNAVIYDYDKNTDVD